MLRSVMAAGSEQRCALVLGDAGIGKTRLVTEASAAAVDNGTIVLNGAGLPLAHGWPFLPVAEALRGLTRAINRPVLDRALSQVADFVPAQVRVLVPELTVTERLAQGAGDGGERQRLFAAVRDLLTAVSRQVPLTVVIEDLHWADQSTLDLLTFLTRSGGELSYALVVTSRSDELRKPHHVLDWIAATERLPSVHTVKLAPLPESEVAELVHALLIDHPGDDFIHEIMSRGEGNPFFTEQLVAAATEAAPPLTANEHLPAAIADLLLSRLRSLSGAARTVVRMLAVAARALDEAELAAALPSVDVSPALRELVGVQAAKPALSDGFRLSHVLLEDAARSELLPSELRSLHTALATAMINRPGQRPAGEIASHWAAAGQPAEELRWSAAAGEDAEHVYAWHEAAVFWLRVDQLWPQVASEQLPDLDRRDVVIRAVDALRIVGEEAAAGEILREVLASGRFDADRLTRARVLFRAAFTADNWSPHGSRGMYEEAAEIFSEFPPSVDQARTLSRIAMLQYDAGDEQAADATIHEARRIAELAHATDVLLGITNVIAIEEIRRGDTAPAQERVREGLRQTRATRHLRPFEAFAVTLTHAQLSAAAFHELVDEGQALLHEIEAIGMRSWGHSTMLANVVGAMLRLGDVATAELLLGAAPDDDPLSGWPRQLSLAEVSLLRGEIATTAKRLRTVAAVRHSNAQIHRWVAELDAELALWNGEPTRANSIASGAFEQLRPDVERHELGRLLWIAARALSDESILAPPSTERPVDPSAEEVELRHVADETGAFTPHPARRVAAGYALAFDAELMRPHPPTRRPPGRPQPANGGACPAGISRATPAGGRPRRCSTCVVTATPSRSCAKRTSWPKSMSP